MKPFKDRNDAYDWLFSVSLRGPIGVLTQSEGQTIVVPQIPSKEAPYAMLWTFPMACEGGY